MVIDASVTQLFGAGKPAATQRPVDLSRVANRQTANRMGIVEGDLPGGYRGVYSTGTKKVDEDVFETRAITRSEYVYGQRDITETRDVYATRDVVETRDVAETHLSGTRDLRPYATALAAGIANGSDFAVTVGSGARATVTFTSATRITVAVGGQSTQFNHAGANGSFRTALVAAMDSIEGLSASLNAEGKLAIVSAQALRVENVPDALGGVGDLLGGLLGGLTGQSPNPLPSLGLAEGTFNPQVVGQTQVVVGTEQYVTGQETVVIGQESARLGERDVVIGSERIKTVTETRIEKGERTLIGLQKSADYGVGYLDVLDKLTSGGRLPPGYVDALFGDGGMRADDPKKVDVPASARGAYSEAESYASRDEPTSNSWSGFKSDED